MDRCHHHPSLSVFYQNKPLLLNKVEDEVELDPQFKMQGTGGEEKGLLQGS